MPSLFSSTTHFPFAREHTSYHNPPPPVYSPTTIPTPAAPIFKSINAASKCASSTQDMARNISANDIKLSMIVRGLGVLPGAATLQLATHRPMVHLDSVRII